MLMSLGFMMATAACGPAGMASPRVTSADYSRQIPTWSDEFDSTLDLSTPTHEGTWRPNDIWQDVSHGYRDFAGTSWNLNPNETPEVDPFGVHNGALSIVAMPTPSDLNSTIAASMRAQGQTGPVPSWSGGFLVTNSNVRTFTYGYYEIRAAFPNVGPGMFPAISLFAANGSTDSHNKGGAEIDLCEVFGWANGNPGTISLHYADNKSAVVREPIVVTTLRQDLKGWHTYALDWQPEYLRFYFDNRLVGQVTGQSAAWFDTPMSLRLNYATDAPWFGSSQTTAASSGTTVLRMSVDYVRVYS